MRKRWGLYGSNSRDFLTYGGRVLVHDNPGELEYLVPIGATVREIPPTFPPDQCMPIRQHPSLAAVSWPLRRQDFRRP